MNLKQNTIILATLLACISGFSQTQLMSFNIRYNNPNDGQNSWENRKEELIQLIDFYQPEILGVQEALIEQLKFIDKALPNYNYIGVGRDDGKEKGEFAAILFDTTQFELIDTKTFWLSPTPQQVSVGWDASMERIATLGSFKNKTTKDTLFVFNCHFDHIGKVAREKSAQLILKEIDKLGLSQSSTVVMGDLNCEAKEKPIQILNEKLDRSMLISEKPHYGPHKTYNGFNTNLKDEKKIDYIFTKNLKVIKHRHIDDRRKNALYISDHFPVLVTVRNF